MKTMKLNLVFALAAVLAASPLLPVAAAEEKKDAAAAEAWKKAALSRTQ